MRWLIFLFIFSAVLVSATREDFELGESIVYDDKNITLVDLSTKVDAAIFCANGVKSIISEGRTKIINGVSITVKNVDSDSVRVNIEYKCRNCLCDDSCDNRICFNGEDEIIEQVEEEIIEVHEETTEVADEEDIVEKDAGIGVFEIFLAILIVVVLILGVLVLWFRR